jgi:hypothetical protein
MMACSAPRTARADVRGGHGRRALDEGQLGDTTLRSRAHPVLSYFLCSWARKTNKPYVRIAYIG